MINHSPAGLFVSVAVIIQHVYSWVALSHAQYFSSPHFKSHFVVAQWWWQWLAKLRRDHHFYLLTAARFWVVTGPSRPVSPSALRVLRVHVHPSVHPYMQSSVRLHWLVLSLLFIYVCCYKRAVLCLSLGVCCWGCLRVYCDIRKQREPSWGKPVYTLCVHYNTWSSYCTHTRAHCAGLQIQLTAAESPSHPLTVEFFYLRSSLDSSFLYESAFNRADLKQRLKTSPSPAGGGCVDLAQMVTELNFHRDAFEKCC